MCQRSTLSIRVETSPTIFLSIENILMKLRDDIYSDISFISRKCFGIIEKKVRDLLPHFESRSFKVIFLSLWTVPIQMLLIFTNYRSLFLYWFIEPSILAFRVPSTCQIVFRYIFNYKFCD